MRHGVDGRKFGRNTSHRLAMFRNLASSVILEEQIVTTLEKAKEARRVVDRLITLSKTPSLHSKRRVFDKTRSKQVVEKLFGADGLGVRFQSRAGGYTRILKMSDRRRGDGAELAVLQLVDARVSPKGKLKKPALVDLNGVQTEIGATPSSVVDPFKRFRRLFQKSSLKG